MSIKIKDNITWFDFETTGLDLNTIGAVSIYAVNYKLKTEVDTLINPEVDIPPEVSKIHGLYKKDVKNKPKFKHIIKSIKSIFESSEYFGGYNILGYDVPLLINLMNREGLSIQGIESKKYVDVFYIVKNLLSKDDLNTLPRLNLESVYNFITGKKLDAHNAKFDTTACVEIIKIFEEQGLPWRDYVLSYQDLASVEITDKDYIVKIGRHCGLSIGQLISDQPSYLKWMVNNKVILLSDNLIKLIK
jgi:DNA polymerase-3 subunit epsilon